MKTVVVAQLVEQSLPKPEIRGSNPNIGKLYLPIVNRKDENKEKEAGNGPFKKRSFCERYQKAARKLKHCFVTVLSQFNTSNFYFALRGPVITLSFHSPFK